MSFVSDHNGQNGSRRILVAGGTGTIGSAVLRNLSERGFQVVALARRHAGLPNLPNVEWRIVDIQDPFSVWQNGFRDDPIDAVISCLASRKGGRLESWLIDDYAQSALIEVSKQKSVRHFVLLSALCVQKPKLEFQFAKLAAEQALMKSGLAYSIVRPTAFFKSLSGQIARVQSGKPFLLFGDGQKTACKPISDRDLANYIVECIGDEARKNKILPIGGPGAAITPRAQGEELFRLLGLQPKFKSVPFVMMDAIIALMNVASFILPILKDKAEFARIGRYYATESMLVLDPSTGHYSAEMTPSTGQYHLFDYYADVIANRARADRHDHSVF